MTTTHDREFLHHGTDLDTNIVIDGAISPYLSGAGLHAVLTGMQAAIDSGAIATLDVHCFGSDDGGTTWLPVLVDATGKVLVV